MKNSKNKLILAAILLLALLLRTIQLSTIPFPLNGDEAAFGYYSHSMAHFGTDEYQNKLPVYFPSIGDYKYPAYVYLNIPLVLIFGLNAFSARLLSALAGVLLVFVTYKLTMLLFKKQRLALLSSLVVAISPWSIIFSRTASESNLATTITLAGAYFFIKFLKEKYKSKKDLLFALALFLFAIYTYSATRIFIPAFLILTIFSFYFYSKNVKKAKTKIVLLSTIIFIIINFLSFIPPESRARANNLSVFNNSAIRSNWLETSITEMGRNNSAPTLLTRAFFNKVTALFWEVSQRYSSHFSPDFLFFQGDRVQINSIPNMGVLYLIDALFLVVGFSFLLSNLSFENSIPAILILAGPLASSLTVETPSAIRQLIGFPGLAMSVGYGIYIFFNKLRKYKLFKNLLILAVVAIYLYLFIYMLVNLFKINPVDQPWTTAQGTKEMVNYVWQNKDKYEAVAMPQSPYIHFLFYEKISPKEFTKNSDILPPGEGQWAKAISFYNIFFDMNVNCPKIGKENVLYVCRGQEVPKSAKVLKVIRFGDGIPAYILLSFEKMTVDKQGKTPLPANLYYMAEGDGRYPEGIFPQDYAKYW